MSACTIAAQVAGISRDYVYGCLNMRCSPYRSYGPSKRKVLSENAAKLANALERDPAELFPLDLYTRKFPRLLAANVEAEHLLPLSSAAGESVPNDGIENLRRLELANVTSEVLKTLTSKENQVLSLRFGLDGEGERTLQQIGTLFQRTPGRIREIETKALRKLRHPSRSEHLRPLLA